MSTDQPVTVEQVADHILQLARDGKVLEAWGLYHQVLVAAPRHPQFVALLEHLPLHYDESFYAGIRPRSLQSAQRILGLLAPHHAFRSVVDFGAGVGTWLEAARGLGATLAVGVEGAWVERSPLRFTGAEYRYQDLNESVQLGRRFDLAVSVEVAEHLHPRRGPGFVDDICRAADHVLFAAALPRQGGDGHINCRPHSYWVAEFRRNGYQCLDLFRPQIWFDPGVEPWYAQNCFLFVRENDPLTRSLPPAVLLDVYHPLLVNEHVQRDHQAGRLDPGPQE